MKRVQVISTAFLSCVLLGATAFGYAQDRQEESKGEDKKQAEPEKQPAQKQQQDKQKPQQRQQKDRGKQQQDVQKQQQKDQGRQQQDAQRQQQQQQKDQSKQQQDVQKQQQKDQGRQQQDAQRQQPDRAQPAQLQRTQEQQHAQQGEQRNAWQQHRAHNFDSEHRTWQQRGGYSGFRIPDVYFTSYYGRDHFFSVYSLPFLMVGGLPRFQYSGYWFTFVDPCPEYWGDDWYQTDNVYVDYFDGGYYLYNSRYPNRPGVAISISM